jgi:hypothetical protein
MERRVLFDAREYANYGQWITSLKHFDWARLTFELDSCMDEVHRLVRAIYRA